MRTLTLSLCAALLLAAAGCTPAPDLGPPDPQSAGAPWPQLLPQAQLRAEAPAGPAPDAAALEARAAALRARAAALRTRQPGD